VLPERPRKPCALGQNTKQPALESEIIAINAHNCTHNGDACIQASAVWSCGA